jgi:3-hydroxyisobutyrate dehydrogenase
VGSRVFELGDASSGTLMKLVINSWLVGLVETLAETIAFAQAAGADPERFIEIIDGGPLGPAYAKLKASMMIEREFPPSFPLRLAVKDARLVLEAAEQAGVELPLVEVVERQMRKAAEAGHADEDLAAAVYGTTQD